MFSVHLFISPRCVSTGDVVIRFYLFVPRSLFYTDSVCLFWMVISLIFSFIYHLASLCLFERRCIGLRVLPFDHLLISPQFVFFECLFFVLLLPSFIWSYFLSVCFFERRCFVSVFFLRICFYSLASVFLFWGSLLTFSFLSFIWFCGLSLSLWVTLLIFFLLLIVLPRFVFLSDIVLFSSHLSSFVSGELFS